MTNAEKAVFRQELQQALGRALKQLRRGHPKKPSQEEMAQVIGMDRTYWGDLERGERSLTLFNLWRVAEAFAMSPSRLVMAIDKQLRRVPRDRVAPEEKTRKQLFEFMDLSPEMKWLADAGQNTLYCNAPLRRYLGPGASVEGHTWRELLHPDDRERHFTENKKAYARREPYWSRYRMRRADGEYKSMVQHAVPQFTPKGVFIGFLGTIIQEPDDS